MNKEKEELTTIQMEENVKEFSEIETISNLVFYPALISLLGLVAGRAKLDPLLSILNGSLILEGTILLNKESSKISMNKYYSPSVFNARMRLLKKALIPIMMAFNIGTIGVSTALFYNYVIKKENPYDGGVYEINGIDVSDVDTLITDAIDRNCLLTDDEKNTIKKLIPYFEDNKYTVEIENIYYNLSTINIYDINQMQEEKPDTLASYVPHLNEIKIYNEEKKETSLPHELVHATGMIEEYLFLTEGLTSIIASEYCQDGRITNGYYREIYLTEIVIELTSPDIVLKAFSKNNVNIIIENLGKKASREEAKELLDAMESLYIDNIKYTNFEEKEELIKKLQNKLIPYLDTSNDNINDQSLKIMEYLEILKYPTHHLLPKYNYNQEKIKAGLLPSVEYYDTKKM